jgi:hypothetical protein
VTNTPWLHWRDPIQPVTQPPVTGCAHKHDLHPAARAAEAIVSPGDVDTQNDLICADHLMIAGSLRPAHSGGSARFTQVEANHVA